ncbi:ABC transporter permease [Nonomuraea antri]|uniref:ABC transporter permease n=1 Tax=Nonomuraea antri TaxID=2730852 RepID=UPI001F18DC74|nr:ABC transporter permease subunit [Nonomuraea antri]
MDSAVICGVLGVIGLFCLAEAAGRLGLISTLQLPLASTIVVTAVELATDPDFLADVGATAAGWALGLLTATALAVPAGLLLGSLPPVERALRPLIEFLRPIPSVALIPLAAFVFTDRLEMKVAMIVYAAAWPILINTMYGLREVDPLAKETLRSFGFGPAAILWRVGLPSAAPFIVTGIRVAAAIALILAVSTELLAGGTSGIGRFIILAESSPEGLTLTIAATFWAGALGLLTNGLLVLAGRRLLRWHTALTEADR